jgi:hypothetical protein
MKMVVVNYEWLAQVPNSKHVFHGTNELKNMIPSGKYAQVTQGNMVA